MPVVNKITVSIHGDDCIPCVFCHNNNWIWRFKIHIHDKLHLMRPNHIDVNRSPAYKKDNGSSIISFCKLTDHGHATYESWFKDKNKVLINTNDCILICKKCIFVVYEIIPELAYEYAYKYFLLNEYICELSSDKDFIDYMVKNVCDMIIQMLKQSVKTQSKV